MSMEKFEKYDICVLYVEDDLNIRELGKEILMRKVARVFVAENGLIGYNMYREHNPDIVVTDIKMPGMSGLELASQIKDINKETEIIVSSAFSETEYLKRAIDLGISVYVVKPFDSKKLFSAIEKCWESIRLRREVKQKEIELLRANSELEEKVAERTKALKLEHEFRNRLFEMDPSFIMIADEEGKIKFINKTITDIFGNGNPESTRTDCFNLKFDSKGNVNGKSITSLIENKKNIESVFVFNEKTYSVLWNFRYINQDNKSSEILCHGTDISYRKEFESLLDKRNRLLRAASLSANYFITISNVETALKQCLELVGIAMECNMALFLEPPNKTNRKSWPHNSLCYWSADSSGDSLAVGCKIETMSLLINDNRMKMLMGGEYLILPCMDLVDLDTNKSAQNHLSGRYLIIPILVDSILSGILIFAANDKFEIWDEGEVSILQTLASTLGNVFRRKITEDELKKLSTAVDQSSSAVIVTDRFGNIEYVNSKFTEITQYKLTEVIGKNPRFLKSGKHPDDIYKNLWDTISSGSEWHGEMYNKKKDDEYYWALVSISPIRNDLNEITHFIAIQEDITKNRMISEELEKSKIAAEAASSAKTIFLANMSHELRTPLNGIMGMTSLLEYTGLNEKQAGYLKMVKSSSEILLRLITDILDLTKIESGKLELKNSLFNTKAKIMESIDALSSTKDRKDLVFRYTIDPDIPQFLIGDYQRLQQIINNILGNALKFTENGSIDISVVKSGQFSNKTELLFTVSDTGIGISKENYAYLFKRFSQVDGSTTRKYGGSGLGLAISKQIVEMMDGKIWFESEEGSGSKFYFTVKLESTNQEEKEKTVNGDPHGIPIAASSKNSSSYILLVEDSQINRFLLTNVLEEHGYRVDSAADGLQAIEKIEKNSYDAVLMDIQMPVMDGFEATAKIRESEQLTKKHLPIIALTAHAFEEDRKRCLDAGMDHYISKPVDYEQLFSVIELVTKKAEKEEKLADVDLTDLLKAINNNQIIYDKLVKYFIDNYPSQLKDLIDSVKNKDYESTVRGSHTLKAAVGNFGAKLAFDLIRKLEIMGNNKNLSDSDEIMAEIIEELKRVESYLINHVI